MSAPPSGPAGPDAEGPRADLATLYTRHPRLLALTLGLIVVAGLSAYAVLPRAEDPVLSGRVARIVTRFPGASPERVEALVTEKLEDELLEVAELDRVVSDSRSGVSVIVLEVDDAVADPSPVWTKVRDRIDDALPALPAGCGRPDLEEMTIVAYTLIAGLGPREGAPPLDPGALRRLAQGLRDRLRAVPGTVDVDVWGAGREEILVEVPGQRLVALGRTAHDLAREVAQADAKVAAGQLRAPARDLLLEVEGELGSVERVRALPVLSGSDGRVVRLGDVARVTKGTAQPAAELALLSGREGVAVAARMGTGARVELWAAAARAALDGYAAGLPADVALEVVFDQSRYTAARLDGLAWNLALGVALVVAVMFAFMGWRSAVIVGLALPLTALCVLAGMRALAVPVHQMSITGLIIAIGLLIDNAIVTVDEVRARLARGLDVVAAVGATVRHLAVPLGASTLTTALAFMPMVLMPGPSGEFVGAIGLTVVLALVSSLLLSLTVIPALGAWLGLRPADAGGPWWRTGAGSPALTAAYRRALGALLRRPALAIGLAVAAPLAGFAAATGLEEQFFPPADRDQVLVELRLPTTGSLGGTRAAVERARALLREDPAVVDVHWFLGRTAPKFYYNMLAGQDGAAFFAQGLVQLRAAERPAETIRALQARLDQGLPAAQALVKQLEQGPPFEAPIELFVLGPDLAELARQGEALRGHLAALPDVIHTRASLQDGQPKLWLGLDEEEARRAGLEPVALAGQLEAALEGVTGGSLVEGTEELPVRVRVVDAARTEVDRIASLPVFGPPHADGLRRSVPLSALARVELRPEVARVSRRNGQRVNTVQGFVQAGVLPSRVLGQLRAALARSGFALPPGYRLDVGGESLERDRAVTNLLASAGVLLVLMIAALVLAFDSFRQAALIGLVGLLSVGLALGALWLGGMPFGFMAIIGVMGLVGVAINDSIVVLAALREDPRAAAGDAAAAVDVVVAATRHVLATTVTTAAGFAPLLLGGDAFWQPLATTIAGGVTGATLLAITLVPAAFLLQARAACPATARAGAGGPGGPIAQASGRTLVAATAGG